MYTIKLKKALKSVVVALVVLLLSNLLLALTEGFWRILILIIGGM